MILIFLLYLAIFGLGTVFVKLCLQWWGEGTGYVTGWGTLGIHSITLERNALFCLSDTIHKGHFPAFPHPPPPSLPVHTHFSQPGADASAACSLTMSKKVFAVGGNGSMHLASASIFSEFRNLQSIQLHSSSFLCIFLPWLIPQSVISFLSLRNASEIFVLSCSPALL